MNSEFFSMGGYAFFVWVSYGLSAVVLIANAWWPVYREKRLLQAIARRTEEKPHES